LVYSIYGKNINYCEQIYSNVSFWETEVLGIIFDINTLGSI